MLKFLDLIEAKNVGIMDLLNEEGKLPKSSEEHFTAEVHHKYAKHFRLAVSKKSLHFLQLLCCLFYCYLNFAPI